MLTQTSLLAFKSLDAVKLGNRQQEVFETIEYLQPCTDKHIAEHLNYPINTITPRRGELAQKRLIQPAYVKKDTNGRMAIYWKIRVPKAIEDIE